MKQQRYRVALFNRGGERAGVERELAREPRLEVARARYNESVATYPAGSASDALRPRHGVGAERHIRCVGPDEQRGDLRLVCPYQDGQILETRRD